MKLNFGCGNEILEGFDNFDKNDFDFNIFPYPIKDNTYDYVYSKCVLEHLFDIRMVLKELHRIAKNNGKIEIIVPYYNNYTAFSDVGHLHYFNKRSFEDLKMEEYFEMNIKLISSKVGLIFPFKNFLSRYFNGLIKQIKVELIIKK